VENVEQGYACLCILVKLLRFHGNRQKQLLCSEWVVIGYDAREPIEYLGF